MKITKIGHCCLLIKFPELAILTDPGVFSHEQNFLEGIDVVLITHEHSDHFHIDSLKKVLENNPNVQIFTNSAVGRLLADAGISHSILEGREKNQIKGIDIEAFDAKHVEIFQEVGQVQNTGYFIDGKLFYPGDAYAIPDKSVEILALPVAGPWAEVKDVINYALEVNPAMVFPVHDGILNELGIPLFYRIIENNLTNNSKIAFTSLRTGESKNF